MGGALLSAVGTAVSAIGTIVIVYLVGALAGNLIGPICNMFINLSVNPLSIPFVNSAILWAELGALVVCIAIRVGRGVYELILNPSDKSQGFGEWVVKSVLSIACIVLMPLACTFIAYIGDLMLDAIQGSVSATGAVVQLNPGNLSEDFINGIADLSLEECAGTLANAVLIIFVIAAIIMVTFQLFKRQIIIYYVTIISTWVAVKSSMDSFDDCVDMLASLVGLVLTQWVQYLAMAVAITMVNSFVGDTAWIELDISVNNGEAITSYIMIFAFLGAALGIPQVMERYAFSAGRSGAGNMIVGAAVRGGIGGLGRIPRAAGGLVKGAGNGIMAMTHKGK